MTLDHAALVTAAAIGIRTRQIDLTDLPAELLALVPKRTETDSTEPSDAAAFLAAASGYAVARRGTLPSASGVAISEPPDPETLPLPPSAVQALLPRLVDTTPVLLEALAMVAAAGHRVPEAAVPILLARGPEVRAATVPVMGEVGRWLCSLNPAWTPLLQSSSPRNRRTGPSSPPAGPTAAEMAAVLESLARADAAAPPELKQFTVPWPRELAIAVGSWLMARLSPPRSGQPCTSAPPSLWDRWAVAVPRSDAREAAVATQNAIGAARHGGATAAATTRAHRAVHVLTLRSILHEEYQ